MNLLIKIKDLFKQTPEKIIFSYFNESLYKEYKKLDNSLLKKYVDTYNMMLEKIRRTNISLSKNKWNFIDGASIKINSSRMKSYMNKSIILTDKEYDIIDSKIFEEPVGFVSIVVDNIKREREFFNELMRVVKRKIIEKNKSLYNIRGDTSERTGLIDNDRFENEFPEINNSIEELKSFYELNTSPDSELDDISFAILAPANSNIDFEKQFYTIKDYVNKREELITNLFNNVIKESRSYSKME